MLNLGQIHGVGIIPKMLDKYGMLLNGTFGGYRDKLIAELSSYENVVEINKRIEYLFYNSTADSIMSGNLMTAIDYHVV